VSTDSRTLRDSVVRDRLIGRVVGARPGTRLIIVGALHGNEPAGVLAAQRVLKALAGVDPERVSGSFVALVGNVAACNEPDPDTRYIETDMNRSFTPGCLERARTLPDDDLGPEELEVRALSAIIEQEIGGERAVLADLHTTSAPSPPFAAMEDTLAARKVVRCLPLPVILGLEEELPGLLFDHALNTHGIVSFIVESGQHNDPASVDGHEAVIWTLLDALGIVPIEGGPVEHEIDPRLILRKAAGPLERAVFDVRHREAIVEHDYETLPGRTTFEKVKRLQTPIGRQGGHTLVAPLSGQLFMPNRQPKRRPGDDAYFIVREVSRGWLDLSARLRKSAWMDTWTPRLLPGVRARPGHPGQLLVAPDIAVVLKRQLLHLLGYRLLRHTPVPHLSRPARSWQGVRTLVRAGLTMITGLFSGGERARLSAERDEDWIIARRSLDRDPPA